MSGPSDALVVIVHFGAVEPTVKLANSAWQFDGASIVVVANDGKPRPRHLAHGVRWVPSANTGYFGALRVGLESTHDSAVRRIAEQRHRDACTDVRPLP